MDKAKGSKVIIVEPIQVFIVIFPNFFVTLNFKKIKGDGEQKKILCNEN